MSFKADGFKEEFETEELETETSNFYGKQITAQEDAQTSDEGFKVQKQAETKSQRVNIVLKPTTYKNAKKLAKKMGARSFNDFVEQLLEHYIEKELGVKN